MVKKTVFKGKLGKPAFWEASNETVSTADFSKLLIPGKYVVVTEGNVKSFPFEIKNEIYKDITKAGIKAFYLNRCGIELLPKYAGKFARPAGHPDNKVIVLPSAASASRPAGTEISTPFGWYDAGDYNKYIVNSGISTYTLLAAYQYYPEVFKKLSLNIPESGNTMPDILDEALWNIRWIFTMQDPGDGGVYNKTTNAGFDAMSLPHLCTSPRYVCAKGTAAALDFAAVMALTSRVYRAYMPAFADSCLQKAKLAWTWAVANPNVAFRNPNAESGYPAVLTGGYGDNNFSDEFAWAATELYISTKEAQYKKAMKLDENNFDLPTWGGVKSLSLVSLVVNKKQLEKDVDYKLVAKQLEGLTKPMVRYQQDSSPYKVTINYFEWGSNSFVANQGVMLACAYRLTGNKAYYDAAFSAFDYLLGRNATNYCFISGFGSKSPQNLHHRPTAGDGIAEPLPGFLVGGPNPRNTDDCGGAQAYPSKYPAICYLDNTCSYSTNEIAINWNAPFVFLAGAVQSKK